MITVFHKGDAPEILATLRELGIAVTEYDLRRCPPEAAWAAGQHLVAIGRATRLGGDDHAYELLTPTTTIENGHGRSIIGGDHPDTVLAKLPPLVPAARGDRPAPVVYGVHEQQPDGRCSCKTSLGVQVLAEVNVTEPLPSKATVMLDDEGHEHYTPEVGQ